MKLMRIQIDALIAKAKPVLLAKEKARFAAAARAVHVVNLKKDAMRLEKEANALRALANKAANKLATTVDRIVKPEIGSIQAGRGVLTYSENSWQSQIDEKLRNKILLLSLDDKDIATMDELFKQLVG